MVAINKLLFVWPCFQTQINVKSYCCLQHISFWGAFAILFSNPEEYHWDIVLLFHLTLYQLWGVSLGHRPLVYPTTFFPYTFFLAIPSFVSAWPSFTLSDWVWQISHLVNLNGNVLTGDGMKARRTGYAGNLNSRNYRSCLGFICWTMLEIYMLWMLVPRTQTLPHLLQLQCGITEVLDP